MKSLPLMLILGVLLASCSFNKLYLIPHKLSESSTFCQYDDEKQDSLRLTFEPKGAPLFRYDHNGPRKMNYSIENVYLRNGLGDSLHAWFFRPSTTGNSTTLLFLHGNAGNVVYQYALVEPFVERGYKVLLLDYSGFGFSQGKAKRKQLPDDANAALDYIHSREDITASEKIVIYGQSLGGHLAASISSLQEDRIDALVVEGAFSSHHDIAAEGFKFLGRIFVREMYSAEKRLPDFNKPVLIIHSREDETIPFRHGERLYEVAKEPKQFFPIDGKHIYGPLLYADEIDLRIQQLLK